MWRTIRAVLICLALGGCATTSSMMPSMPSIGGSNEPAKPASAVQPAAAQEDSGSGLGGIWKNFSSPFSSGAQPASQRTEAYPQTFDPNEALRLINNYRSTKGLAPLSLDPQATAAAEGLAKDMAKHDRMDRPNGKELGKRLLAAGYDYNIAAENVAVGQKTVEQTIEGWKVGAADSRNLLNANAKHIGIAYENRPASQHKTFWVLVVAAPCSSPSECS